MRKLLLAAGAVLLLAITGCVDAEPRVTPGPTPSATPAFASDEEALAAAEAAYGAYTKLADQIFMEGGANPERLSEVAVRDQLMAEIQGFQGVEKQGLHSVGATVFRDISLQQSDFFALEGTVTIYVCEDISGVDVLDSSGASVVSSNRPDLVRYEVVFDRKSGGSSLVVAEKQAWESPC